MTVVEQPTPPSAATGTVTTSLRGLVAEIDDGVARVFVGDNDQEWFFPARLFPSGTEAGDCVWLQRVDGRYTVVGATPDRANPDVRGFAERLDRLRSARHSLLTSPRRSA